MYLGGANHAGLIIPVFNTSSTTIARGTVASLAPDADGVYGSLDIQRYAAANSGRHWVVPVQNWVVTTQALSLGVAVDPIPQGYSGLLMVQGFCWVKTGGSVAQSQKLQLATGGILETYSAGVRVGMAVLTDMLDTEEADWESSPSSQTWTLAYVDFTNTFTE